jgi:hypothetical protein
MNGQLHSRSSYLRRQGLCCLLNKRLWAPELFWTLWRRVIPFNWIDQHVTKSLY